MAFKRKFQVGDEVKVVKTSIAARRFQDKVGVITNVFKSSTGLLYLVVIKDNSERWFTATNLELNKVCECSTKAVSTESTTKSTISDDQLSRMGTELNELLDRLTKLNNFVGSQGFIALDDQTKMELVIQLDAMRIYYNILAQRYNRLKSTKTSNAVFMD